MGDAMISGLRTLKQRLQFTGWLQYILNFVLALMAGLIWAVLSLVGLSGLAWGFGILALALLAVMVFDLITVRAGLAPREPLPAAPDMTPLDSIFARRACRSFQRRDLTQDHLTRLRDWAAAQSTYGIHFVYLKAPLKVWPVVGASDFLVALAPASYDRRAIIEIGQKLEQIVLSATADGMASCWIGPGADHASIRTHLGDRFDPTRHHIVCVCAFGYASVFKPLVTRIATLVQHRRKALDQLVFTDAACERPATLSPEMSATFEACRWAPSSFNAQPVRAHIAVNHTGMCQQVDLKLAQSSRFYGPIALGIWMAHWDIAAKAAGMDGRWSVTAEPHPTPPPCLPQTDATWRAS